MFWVTQINGAVLMDIISQTIILITAQCLSRLTALQISLQPFQEPKHCRLFTKDPKNVKLYIERKYK
jgi:hypothetical protein